jgi:hypothetical protein
MGELRKITIQVDQGDLEKAQELTGAGVTETIRVALQKLLQLHAQHEASKLRGKVKFSMGLDELRYDRE